MSEDGAKTRQVLRDRLRLTAADIDAVNGFLSGGQSRLMDGLLDLVEEFGGVEAINRAAAVAGDLHNRLARLEEER